MSKGKKVGRIISIAATVLNAVLWLGASVYFARPFITDRENLEGPGVFVYLVFLVCCVMGFVNAALLLLGVILYHKSHRRSAVICALLLYLCPVVTAFVFFGLIKAVWSVSIAAILWVLGVNACIVLLIVGFVKSKKLPQSAPPTAPSERAPG